MGAPDQNAGLRPCVWTLQERGIPALARKLTEIFFRVEQYAEMVLTYLRLDAGSTDMCSGHMIWTAS